MRPGPPLPEYLTTKSPYGGWSPGALIGSIGNALGAGLVGTAASVTQSEMPTQSVRVLGADSDEVDVVRWEDELMVAAQSRGADLHTVVSTNPWGPDAPRCAAFRFVVGRDVEAASLELAFIHDTLPLAVVGEAVGTGNGHNCYFTLDSPPIVPNSQTIWVNAVPQVEGVDYNLDDATGVIWFFPASAPGAGLAVTATYTSEMVNLPTGSVWAAIYSGDIDQPLVRLGVLGYRIAQRIGYSAQVVAYFDCSAYDPAVESISLTTGTYYWVAICGADPAQAVPPVAESWAWQALFARKLIEVGAGRLVTDNAGAHRPEDWGPGDWDTDDGHMPWFRLYERVAVLRGVPVSVPDVVPSIGEYSEITRVGGRRQQRVLTGPQTGFNSALPYTSNRGSIGSTGPGGTHNSLSNIQGGDLANRWHLSLAEYQGTWGHFLQARDSVIPLVGIRDSALTNSYASGLWLQHITTGDMADGFAVGILFSIQDNAGVSNPVGRLSVVRSGGDDQTGDFVWSPYAAGAPNERMRLTSAGNLGLIATGRVYLDGTACTGNTYLYESGGDLASLVVGGTERMRWGAHVGIPALTRLHWDGVALGGNTYTHESAGDTLVDVVGGVSILTRVAAGVTDAGWLNVGAGGYASAVGGIGANHIGIGVVEHASYRVSIDGAYVQLMSRAGQDTWGIVLTTSWDHALEFRNITDGNVATLVLSEDFPQIGGAAGSAANPSFANFNDWNTGMFFVGSDAGGLTAGGVQAFAWAEAGNQTFVNVSPSTYVAAAEGDLSMRSGLRHLQVYIGGAAGALQRTLYQQTVAPVHEGADDPHGGTFAEVVFGSGTYTIPAALWAVGKRIRWRARGVSYSTCAVGGPGPVTIRLRIGGLAGTIIGAPVAWTNAVDGTPRWLPWELEGEVRCITLNAVGPVWARGETKVGAQLTADPTTGAAAAYTDGTTAVFGVGKIWPVNGTLALNTTAAQAVVCTVQHANVGGGAAAYSTLHDFVVEEIV